MYTCNFTHFQNFSITCTYCCVYSEKLLMMDRGTVPKHVELYSKNKFEKLVHLVGFIIRIYHDAWSLERQIMYMTLFLLISGNLMLKNERPT